MSDVSKALGLYKNKEFGDCAGFLYSNFVEGKLVAWGFIVLSLCLSVLSFWLSSVSMNNHSLGAAAFATVVGAAAIAVVVTTFGTAAFGVAAFAAAGGVANFAGAGAAATFAVGAAFGADVFVVVAFATVVVATFVVGAAFGAVFGATAVGDRFYCWITLKTIKRNKKRIGERDNNKKVTKMRNERK